MPFNVDGGRSSCLLEVKRAVLVPQDVFSLKQSTVGAFSVPFKLLSRKHMIGDNVLSVVFSTFQGAGMVGNVSSHAHKTGS